MDNQINQIDNSHIKIDWKICSKQNSQACIITGPDSVSWAGRVCGKCYAIVRAAVYQANKKVINDKITVKRRIVRAKFIAQKAIDKLTAKNELNIVN